MRKINVFKKTINPMTDKIAFFAANMSLFITSLNSGSNGNCYYVGNHNEAVLIDVGISCRETEKRMKKLGLDIKKVKAIFVSHEHGDHIKGVSTLANKYNLPVYITSKTAKNGPRLIGHLTKRFEPNVPLTIGDLIIKAFVKSHDAADPHSFIVSCKDITVGVMTDIGNICTEVIHHFKQCNAVFLEANFDEAMLENGKYPQHLKNRIRGGQGHLSNSEALKLFINYRSDLLSHLILSHLSKENNSPEIVANLFEPHANNTKIIVASRYESTPVFNIQPFSGEIKKTAIPFLNAPQLSLFE